MSTYLKKQADNGQPRMSAEEYYKSRSQPNTSGGNPGNPTTPPTTNPPDNSGGGLLDKFKKWKDNIDLYNVLHMVASPGKGTAIRGLGGAGLGYLLAKLVGGKGWMGSLVGGLAGVTPDIIKYAPKVLNGIKGMFKSSSAANAVALCNIVEPMLEKKANGILDLALSAAALRGARNIGQQRSVDLNQVHVPQGALPPEELLLPEVRNEGRKATLKSIVKNLGLGALGGAGIGALTGALTADPGKRQDGAIGMGLLGALLGTGGGVLSSAVLTPDARLEAMRKKHNELNGYA